VLPYLSLGRSEGVECPCGQAVVATADCHSGTCKIQDQDAVERVYPENKITNNIRNSLSGIAIISK